jgi:hypothetical protein
MHDRPPRDGKDREVNPEAANEKPPEGRWSLSGLAHRCHVLRPFLTDC